MFLLYCCSSHTRTCTHINIHRAKTDDNMNTNGSISLRVSQESPHVGTRWRRQTRSRLLETALTSERISSKLFLSFFLPPSLWWPIHIAFVLGVYGCLPVSVYACMCECVVYWQDRCSHVPENEANQAGQFISKHQSLACCLTHIPVLPDRLSEAGIKRHRSC